MKNIVKLTLSTLLCLTGVSQAAVSVTAGDFTGTNYTYEIPITSASAFQNAHNAVVHSSTGVSYRSESGSLITYTFAGNSNSLVYRWSFSGVVPLKATIRDTATLFTGSGEQARATISFSTNGTDYTPIRVFNSSDSPSGSTETSNVSLGAGASEFYYKVEMDDVVGTLDSIEKQWLRSTIHATNPSPFSATFSTVPEPSSTALLSLAGFSLLIRRRR